MTWFISKPASAVKSDTPHLTSDAVTSRDLTDRIVNQATDGYDPNSTTPNYTYDRAGRLTGAVGFAEAPSGTANTHSYAYDYTSTACGVATTAGKNANRVSKTVDSGTPVTYCYDHADRLTATSDPAASAVNMTGGTLDYDDHGNTSTLDDEDHIYDVADRHLETSGSGLPTVEYSRDATDRITSRTATGETTVRYAHTGDTDSPQVVLNTNNQVISTSIALPGGAVLHVTGASTNWSYPNMQGTIAAQANTSGTKTAGTFIYTPDGTPAAGGLPDTRPGNLDDTWLGAHQRPLEHAPGLQPIIQMGARQYHPILARFLEVDPIESGVHNDYGYVSDLINTSDTSGSMIDVARCALTTHFEACYYAATIGASIAKKAASIAGLPKYKWRTGRTNAFRHALWSAAVAYRYGVSVAFQVLDSHEPAFIRDHDSRVDSWNNYWGAKFGARGAQQHISLDSIAQLLISMVDLNVLFDITGGSGSSYPYSTSSSSPVK